jgi:hypothetical protein
MKDLYARLGLEPGATLEQIEDAAKDSGHSESVAGVLLVADHRAGYDHCHATLTAIGNLRKRLKLDAEPTWFTRECPDFVPGNKETRVSEAAAEQTGATDSYIETELAEEPSAERGLNWPVIAVIVVGVALAVWAVLR